MKGICFKEPLFHKVIEGQKTQTRRIIINCDSLRDSVFVKSGYETCHGYELKPKYNVGETIYLKEPYSLYQEQYQELKNNMSGLQYAYKFGNSISLKEMTGDENSKWKNKLFMPESAARYFIKITAVRAERLQEISEEDCIKEGIEYAPIQICSWKDDLTPKWSNGYNRYNSPQDAYAALIDKINGKGTWDNNVWVWVYDFELIHD